MAAIANIAVLQASGLRRTLLATFLLASLLLVFYISRERASREEAAIREYRKELEEGLLRQRDAMAEASRRIEQERKMYDHAVEEALSKMQADFRRQLEERAVELVKDSQVTEEAYDHIKQLIQSRESLRRQDIRNFLRGEWVSLNPNKNIFGKVVPDGCFMTFSEQSILERAGYLSSYQYEISDIQGNEIFLRWLTPTAHILQIVVDFQSRQIYLQRQDLYPERKVSSSMILGAGPGTAAETSILTPSLATSSRPDRQFRGRLSLGSSSADPEAHGLER